MVYIYGLYLYAIYIYVMYTPVGDFPCQKYRVYTVYV